MNTMNTMNTTYTAAERAAGFAWANAKAAAEHAKAQLLLPEADRVSYAVTDAQFADSMRDKVGENYYDQMIEERVKSPENVAWAERIAATLSNPTVAAKFAETQAAVVVAEATV